MADGKLHEAKGSPTKPFFVEMLTKDIELKDAILDLVDNSVDAARRFPDLENRTVEIDLDASSFRIKDNCGGMTLEDAEQRAFRFGRDPRVEPQTDAIGLYGVGMKRAMFKIGQGFRVESYGQNSHFVVATSTQAWLGKGDTDWSFPFDIYEPKFEPSPDQELGTTIEVRPLHPATKADFEKPSFLIDLKLRIERVHQEILRKGLKITLNGPHLTSTRPYLLTSEMFQPVRVFRKVGDVSIDLTVGIAESKPPSNAGWYLFCNDRLILNADQSYVTGWGERDIERIPKFHNQFSRFRGYVKLSSRDGRQLPWDTTKSGLDENSDLFVSVVRPLIVQHARPVIHFLNFLDAEQDEPSKPLTLAVESASKVVIADLPLNPVFFKGEVQPKSEKETLVNISYKRHPDDVERAKELLGVKTTRQVGEKTFEYYLKLNDNG